MGSATPTTKLAAGLQSQSTAAAISSAPQPADPLIGHGLGHIEFALGDHVLDHRGLDGSRADRVHADAAGRVLEGRAPGEADDAVFGGVVGGAARESD
jgi:hypothetical protein